MLLFFQILLTPNVFVSCSLWLKYGMLSEDSTMIFVNLVGAIIEGIYVIIFYINTKQKVSFQCCYDCMILLFFFH